MAALKKLPGAAAPDDGGALDEGGAPGSLLWDGRGRNCLGMRLLLAGHSLVPDPPAMIIQSLNTVLSLRYFWH